MPGVSRLGVNQALNHLEPLVAIGLETILLFGVVETLRKVSEIMRFFRCTQRHFCCCHDL